VFKQESRDLEQLVSSNAFSCLHYCNIQCSVLRKHVVVVVQDRRYMRSGLAAVGLLTRGHAARLI